MNAVEPGWVAILMMIMTAIGALIPKIQEWFSKKKKEDQEGAAFLLTSYKETILQQDAKLQKLEQKLVDVQQKVVDIQTANVTTLMENAKMKEQIQILTIENTDLRLKVSDLERRIPK
jgi:hypothetical protein